MQRMDFALQKQSAKSTDEGIVEGFASTYGNADRHDDRVMPGAFAKTLAERGGYFPLLWQHKADEPIGLASVFDSATGLALKARLDIDVEAGRRAFSAVRKGIVGAFSIGYDVIKARRGRDGKREITEIRLWEVSLVTFPANPQAVVTGAKGELNEDSLMDFRTLVNETAGYVSKLKRSGDPLRQLSGLVGAASRLSRRVR